MAKPTLAQTAADQLIAYIKEAGLTPGSKLPTEAELSEKLSVGRNTVREALRILLSRNIVETRQGSGTYLSEKNGVSDDPFGFSMVTDTRALTEDLMQVRLILEPKIAAIAADKRTDEDLKNLEEILLPMEEQIDKREDFSSLDAAFHEAIAKSTHNAFMGQLIPVITNGVDLYARTVEETEYLMTRKMHRKIFEAIREQSANEAEQAMSYHLLFNRYRF